MIKLSKKNEGKTTYLRLRRRTDKTWNVDVKVKMPKLTLSQVAELQTFANALVSHQITDVELPKLYQDKRDQLEDFPIVLNLFKKAGLIKGKPKELYSCRKVLKALVEKDQLSCDAGYLVQSTVEKRKRVVKRFLEYIEREHKTKDYDIRKIDFKIAEGFRDFRLLENEISEHFVRAEIKWIRGYFRKITTNGLIKRNPFDGVKVSIKLDQDDRRVFIPSILLDEIEAWLKKHKRHSWYVYWALVRWTGCRKTECLQLKWSDIDWTNETISMPSPKTRRTGKTHRKMPIYIDSPLLEILEDLFDYQGEPKKGYVVRNLLRLGDNERDGVKWEQKNPSTSLEWFIIQAGVAPWAKLMQNLRVTRENELLQSGEYRPEAIHQFIGHSRKTFEANYTRLNDDDFKPRSRLKTEIVILTDEFGLRYSPNYVPRISRKSTDHLRKIQQKVLVNE